MDPSFFMHTEGGQFVLDDEKVWELLLARLSRREHTFKELARYLKGKGAEPDQIDRLAARARELGYLSDERAARIWAREWALRGQGIEGIRRKLSLLKGVRATAEQIEEWLSDGQARAPELERAVAWIQRRYAGFSTDEKLRRRAFAALVRRGFSMEIAKRAVSLPE